MEMKSKVSVAVVVSSAGTAEQASETSQSAYSIIIQAHPDNVGNLFVGDSTVDSNNGIILEPKDVYIMSAVDYGINELNLSDVYIDAEQNNDEARIQYITTRST